MNMLFSPSIKKISLRNTKIISSTTFDKRVKGDIYYNDKCIGAYNPLQYYNDDSILPARFVKIDEEYKNKIKKITNSYFAMCFFPMQNINTKDKSLSIGLDGLLYDLEMLVEIYTFMCTANGDNNDFKKNNVMGILNGNKMYCLKITKNTEKITTSIELQKYIKEYNIPITISNNEPVHIFSTIEDFVI